MNSTAEAIRDQCRQLAIRDRHHQLLEVLEQVPLERMRSDADMAFWHALALHSTVRYIHGKDATEEFVRRFSSPDNRLALARSHLLQSHLYIMDGDTEASYNNELKVVTLLPEDAYAPGPLSTPWPVT